jgi:nitrate reductase NapD
MMVSGVLVVVPTKRLRSAMKTLAELEGVAVHHTDPGSGRLIVTLEAESVGVQVDVLDRIKALPDVILAEMVHHHFEDQRLPESRPGAVPEYLNE